MSDQMNMGKGFLKDKLGDYQVNPPENVWNSISARLGGGSRRRLFVFVLASAATIALAITLGINYFGPDIPAIERVAETETESVQSAEADNQVINSQPETLNEKVVRVMESVQQEDASKIAEYRLTQEINDVPDQIPEYTGKDMVEDIDRVQLTEQKTNDTEDPDDTGDLDVTKDPDDTKDPGKDQTDDTPLDLKLDANGDLAQDPVPDLDLNQKKDPRWMVGAVMSPLYSFRDAEGNAMANGSEHESGMIAYAGGIKVSYRGASRLSIESGLIYNKMGIAIGAPGIQLLDRTFDFAPSGAEFNRADVTAITNSVGNIVASSGEIYVNGYKLNAEYSENVITAPLNPVDAQVADQGIQQHLDYLELPFNLRYTVVDRNFELQIVGGVSTNFLVDNYVTMETSSGTTEIGYLTNIKNVNYSGTAGIGMIYHLENKFSLSLEPRFRYFLNSVNDFTLPSTRPYTLGIYAGLNYTF